MLYKRGLAHGGGMSALFDDGRDENNRNKSRGREREKKKGGKKVVVMVGGWM